MEPVRWGILSTARIGTKKLIPGLLKSPNVRVCGIASRDLGRAQRVAAELGIPRAHASYEALLADPDIEVVYNPLPNDLHVPMTLAAVRAGKHVLCEKPMAMSAAELQVLRPYAEQVHIGEAFMVRHHPQWTEARRRVRNGAIGELRFMQVAFNYFNVDPANIRNRSQHGGGALYDIGCYAVVAGRWFFEAPAQRVIATMDVDPRFGVDRSTSALLDFGGGRQLVFSVSTQAAPWQHVTLCGTKGRIGIEIPFNAAPDKACRLTMDDGSTLDGGSRVETLIDAADQYQLQGEAFSHAVRTQRPDATALDDAFANLRIIDALIASTRSGKFEQP